LIDRVRALNVYGDADIDSQIAQLEQALGPRRRAAASPSPRSSRRSLRLQDTCKEAVSEAFTVDPLLARFSAIDLNGTVDLADEASVRDMLPLIGGVGT
jgi:hypothetical protein